jgi:uncharacterized protein
MRAVKSAVTSPGNYFLAGHLNTGGNHYHESKGVVAHNFVHHSRQYTSQVTLTVVKK